MSSVPEGRAANQPLAATTFNPPMAAPLPGAWVRAALDFFAGQFCELILAGGQFGQGGFLGRLSQGIDARVDRVAELIGQFLVNFSRGHAPRAP
jgi:hypothetical protein